MNQKVAVIGVGMTKFMRRAQESPGELTAQAVQMALDDAGMDIDDIDAVCLGTAPDAFDGVHMKGEHLIAGAGATSKPYMRHYVGGATGVMSPIHGWMHIASGKFDTCLVIAEEKMSPCNPHPAGAFLTIFDHTLEQPLDLTLIHIFALEMARFMHVYGYTEEDLAWVSCNNKRNALDHPAAQIAEDLTIEDVMRSKLLSWPVKRYDISPTSDAAVAIVMTNERVARARSRKPVFIEGVGFRLETAYWCTRDLAYPDYVAMAAKDAYKMAGVVDPVNEIDIFEPYDPFDYKALHHLNGLLLDKTGRTVKDLLHSGSFERSSTHPLCPSGGALGVGNPIAATGLMKIAELYLQLSGQAGKRQVQNRCRRGVAQAWGDLMQAGTVVVMGSEGALPNESSFWSGAKRADLPGTPLKNVKKVLNVADAPDLRYAWDNGYALTTYLDGLAAGKIRGSYCTETGRMMIPCRAFSELTNLNPVHGYYDLPDTGTIETFTISHVDWDSSPLPEGEVALYAVVAIDGAPDHMGLVHRLGEVDPKDIKIGMRVKAVWKKKEEREGSILDILYFKPYKGKKVLPLKQVKPTEMDATTAKAWPGKIPLTYLYTAGMAGTKFYEELAKGKVLGTYSEESDEVLVPPAIFDEMTMTPLDPVKDARKIDGKLGFIESYTIVYEDRSGHLLDMPEIIVQVGFPGARGTVFGKLDVKPGDEFSEGSSVSLVKVKKGACGPDQILFRVNN
ncbi:MAG: thiolase domain-containing protein [Candidatus Lernaella stagnicola]|nr:thiolase domain-containing protein [Candidatus Lernaella stagnicola]